MRPSALLMLLVVLLAVVDGCVQPFSTPINSDQKNILVVNAFLNTDKDTIIVRLSRTKPLGEAGTVGKESNAVVTLLDEAGNSYPIPPRASGEYFKNNLPLNPAQKTFKLKIRTSDQKEYESGLVTSYKSPPIDSVTWKLTPNGIDVYVDSHDPNNKTRYYRWDYTETFEYNSAFQSLYVYDKSTRQVLRRAAADQIFHCWSKVPSPNVNVGTTSQLSQDVIHQVLFRIPPTSQKIGIKYSLLLQQYAIDNAGYDYWDNVRKLAESQGTLFDPLPVNVLGNMSPLTHPAETVLGYFSAGTVTEKRIFISRIQIPTGAAWNTITDFDYCTQTNGIQIYLKNDVDYLTKYNGLLIDQACDPAPPPGWVPGTPLCDLSVSVPGYSSAPSACIDCRMKLNGATVKPSFWL